MTRRPVILVLLLAAILVAATYFIAYRLRPLIAIDIGHSQAQPGAISARGATEFSFNRRLALAIGRELEDARFQIKLVNLEGTIQVLADRTKTAAEAQFFLSVHHDSVQPQFLTEWEFDGVKRRRSEGFRGFSLFVSRSNPFPSESLVCASAIGRSLKDAGFPPSRYHAEPIPGEGRPFADEENGVHYFDGLAVLRTASSPAVLFEAGVITDLDEEAQLSKADVQSAIAKAVARALPLCPVKKAP